MASQRIAGQKSHIKRQHKGSDANAEGDFRRCHVGEPHRLPDIVREENQKDQREVKEVTMDVLHDQRKGVFAAINFARFSDRA